MYVQLKMVEDHTLGQMILGKPDYPDFFRDQCQLVVTKIPLQIGPCDLSYQMAEKRHNNLKILTIRLKIFKSKLNSLR